MVLMSRRAMSYHLPKPYKVRSSPLIVVEEKKDLFKACLTERRDDGLQVAMASSKQQQQVVGVKAGGGDMEKQRRQQFLAAMDENDRKVISRDAAQGGDVVAKNGEGRAGIQIQALGAGLEGDGFNASDNVRKKESSGDEGGGDTTQALKARDGPQDCPVM